MRTFPTHIVTAAGVVVKNKKDILMVRTHRGGWVFPGGQVEVGENLIQAVIREVKEESNIDITVGKLFSVSSNTGTYEGYNGYGMVPTKVMFDFICEYAGGDLSISEETSETAWIPREKVIDMITSPAVKTRFQAYLRFDGSVKYYEYIVRPEFMMKEERNI
ncbi:DNA mismatch repair protein MutT [Anaerocolumna cellulosilytica]|uniref:DNA mismatch repair protein MutT n=1 Tax=Anaerocolumna cellulosilytica TaxID=433286 RepID=A0A6S6R2G5_9FIRM|nr:NUDIX hydrolase [Anaerocolumna cellulosilytica]MBB5198009.1 ADP-ribose pyrophosphatase YjhB (NUDIX family) [Anaerocolumna cellulosilytica]BCJ95529.1 DNA mismatch repair protein MutT [Anaerocolumna cellulosilytica]